MGKNKKEWAPPIDDDLDEILGKAQADENASVIEEIPVSLIDNNPDNEYPVLDDESMDKLKASIEENGLREYPLVFLKDDGSGRYQMVYGHRRKRAHELLKRETILCKVHPTVMTREEMIIANHESNLYRENVPFMARVKDVVKTFDAYISKGIPATRAKQMLASESEESERTIDRYRRLVTELIPETHPLVDSGQIPLVPAEQISFLSQEYQLDVVNVLRNTGKKLTVSKANMLHEDFNKKKMSAESIKDVIIGKTRQRIRKDKKLEVSKKVQDAIPKEVKPNEYEDFILKCIYAYVSKTVDGDDLYEESAQKGSIKIETEKSKTQKDRHVPVPN